MSLTLTQGSCWLGHPLLFVTKASLAPALLVQDVTVTLHRPIDLVSRILQVHLNVEARLGAETSWNDMTLELAIPGYQH